MRPTARYCFLTASSGSRVPFAIREMESCVRLDVFGVPHAFFGNNPSIQ
jgi:hypothetical protein